MSVMESSERYSKRLPALIENLKIARVGIQPTIAAAGHFVDDAQGRELLEPGIDRGNAGLDEIPGGTGREHRMNLQRLVKAEDRCGLGLEAEAVLLEEIEQPAGAGDGLAGGLDDDSKLKKSAFSLISGGRFKVFVQFGSPGFPVPGASLHRQATLATRQDPHCRWLIPRLSPRLPWCLHLVGCGLC